MHKRILAVGVLLALSSSPANADITKPTIIIKNTSSYYKDINVQVLYDYLDTVTKVWPDTYAGTFSIYISNDMPKNLIIDPRAAAGHTAQVQAFVSANITYNSGLSIYYVITHELVEMAVDPHLNFYAIGPDGNRSLVEVADPVQGTLATLDGESVAAFVTPKYYNLPTAPVIINPYTSSGIGDPNEERTRKPNKVLLPAQQRRNRLSVLPL